jgi:DNA invertase Pin-like site-specific DNA recombinase
VDLVVLDQGIDTTTLYGRLQFNILAAIGEFEREWIKERSMEGCARAVARGMKFGAKPKLIQGGATMLLFSYPLHYEKIPPGEPDGVSVFWNS